MYFLFLLSLSFSLSTLLFRVAFFRQIEGDARSGRSISERDSIGFWTAVIRLSLYNHRRVGEADLPAKGERLITFYSVPSQTDQFGRKGRCLLDKTRRGQKGEAGDTLWNNRRISPVIRNIDKQSYPVTDVEKLESRSSSFSLLRSFNQQPFTRIREVKSPPESTSSILALDTSEGAFFMMHLEMLDLQRLTAVDKAFRFLYGVNVRWCSLWLARISFYDIEQANLIVIFDNALFSFSMFIQKDNCAEA